MGNIHTGMMSCARLWFVVILVALWPRVASAQGGPPLMTDDPDTPGPGHWEINVGMRLESSRHERRLETPRIDLNYGVGRRVQLKFEMPWVSVRDEAHNIQLGAGNATAGVKCRFLGQEGSKLAWSIYPQLEFNVSHSSVVEGIVEEGRELLSADVRTRHRLGGASTVQAALAALVRDDLISREAARYVVVDSLLREWVARQTF